MDQITKYSTVKIIFSYDSEENKLIDIWSTYVSKYLFEYLSIFSNLLIRNGDIFCPKEVILFNKGIKKAIRVAMEDIRQRSCAIDSKNEVMSIDELREYAANLARIAYVLCELNQIKDAINVFRAPSFSIRFEGINK